MQWRRLGDAATAINTPPRQRRARMEQQIRFGTDPTASAGMTARCLSKVLCMNAQKRSLSSSVTSTGNDRILRASHILSAQTPGVGARRDGLTSRMPRGIACRRAGGSCCASSTAGAIAGHEGDAQAEWGARSSAAKGRHHQVSHSELVWSHSSDLPPAAALALFEPFAVGCGARR